MLANTPLSETEGKLASELQRLSKTAMACSTRYLILIAGEQWSSVEVVDRLQLSIWQPAVHVGQVRLCYVRWVESDTIH